MTSRTLLRPPLVDVAIAGAFVAFTLAEAVAGPADQPWWRVAAASAAMILLAWRRQAPILVAALVVLVNIVTNPEAQFSTLLSLVLVCFTVGYESRAPRSYVGLAVVLLPFIGASATHDFEVSDLAAALVFFVGPWTVGVATRERTERAEEAVARADRLERDRELEAARVAQEERTRIARELHDIVSHSISVVTIQTQAVRRRLGPDHAREAEDLAAVEATAREALAEMRRLFGVLRTDGESASLAPQPGLSELGRLVEQTSTGDLLRHAPRRGRPRRAEPGPRPGGVPDRPGGPHQRPAPQRRPSRHGDVALDPDPARGRGARTTGAACATAPPTAGTGSSASANASPCTAAPCGSSRRPRAALGWPRLSR